MFVPGETRNSNRMSRFCLILQENKSSLKWPNEMKCSESNALDFLYILCLYFFLSFLYYNGDDLPCFKN